MNNQNFNNNKINLNSIPPKTTKINIKNNNQINQKRETAKQQCAFLVPETNDGKQFISKDESDMLRDSVNKFF